MSKIHMSETQHQHFGRCVKMTNGLIELLVTVDFGPRVIHFATAGMENMFYQDTEKKPLGEAFPAYEGDICRCYGGHRLWISPEVLPRCYYPDNAPVDVEMLENGALFTAPPEKANGIQKSLMLTLMEDEPAVTVKHFIENTGHWEVELAPWCLTMMDKGVKEVLPMPNRETGLLPNRHFTIWPYTNMADKRVHWGQKFMTLTQDPTEHKPFKMGYNNEAGWAAAFNKGQVFFKFYESVVAGLYPDNGCSYETYTDAAMLEMETLGELTLLAPSESVEITEEWEIYPSPGVPSDDEDEIANLIEKYTGTPGRV